MSGFLTVMIMVGCKNNEKGNDSVSRAWPSIQSVFRFDVRHHSLRRKTIKSM